MDDSLKKRTGIALFWSFLDKGGQQLIQVIILYVMARLVDKSEFGAVAVLSIFSVIANLVQDSGFSSALIRKKEVSQTEYSSVFYFNISISVCIYLIFFFSAPFISYIYENESLTNLSRFIFLAFVFNAFGAIQYVHLVRNMDFRKNTIINVIAGIVSGTVAIIMASQGIGAWSLAVQIVLQMFIRILLLWIIIHWLPSREFSASHLKSMAPYSLKLTATAVLNQVCENIYSNIIGKFFSLGQAGLYSQGKKFNTISQSIISDGIKGAAFPMLAKVNDDKERQKRAFRKVVTITSFICFPATMLLIILSSTIIDFVLSEEWAAAAPILQVVAIGTIFYPLRTLISPLLQALGKSGLIFKLDFAHNILILLSIPLAMQWGIMGLLWGFGIVNILFFIVEMGIACKQINYSVREIFADIVPYLIVAAISFLPGLFFEGRINAHMYIISAFQAIIGGALYLFIIKLSGSVIIKECTELFRHFLKK